MTPALIGRRRIALLVMLTIGLLATLSMVCMAIARGQWVTALVSAVSLCVLVMHVVLVWKWTRPRAVIPPSTVVEAVAAIRAELERISALPLGPEALQRLVEIVEATCHRVELSLEPDGGAAGAVHYRVSSKSPERLLNLLAALRAFDGNTDLVLEGHAVEGTAGLRAGEAIAPSALGLSDDDLRGPSTVASDELGAEDAILVTRLVPSGKELALVQRPCCGPDGKGACLAEIAGLPCGFGYAPTYPPPPAEHAGRGDALRTLRVGLRLSLREAAAVLGLRVVELGELERGAAITDGWNAIERRLRAHAGRPR